MGYHQIQRAKASSYPNGCSLTKFIEPPRGWVALSSVMDYVSHADGTQTKNAIYITKADRVKGEEHDHLLDPLGVKLWNVDAINRQRDLIGGAVPDKDTDENAIMLWDGQNRHQCSQDQARKDIAACHQYLYRFAIPAKPNPMFAAMKAAAAPQAVRGLY